MKSNYQSIYTAFDPYPSYKGSAIHIEKVTNVLANTFGPTLLLTLPRHRSQALGNSLDHFEFQIEEDNYLRRASGFSQWVDHILSQQHQLKIGHFRDIWGGLPIIKRDHLLSIFEVNGLPSIELLNRYPRISPETIDKIKSLENQCLHAANLIICPSVTIKNHLINRNIIHDKIKVIPNGADIPPSYPKPVGLPAQYVVYFGALQPWQGVDTLIKGLLYLQDKPDLKLVICSSHKEKFARVYKKLASKLGLADQVIWKYQIEKAKLYALLQHAVASIVPLTECARNLEQGCSPLKIFESMACRTPIIAAELPVIKQIVSADEATFFRAERPAELARSIRLMMDYPELGKKQSDKAFLKFVSEYTWENIDGQLSFLYKHIVNLVY